MFSWLKNKRIYLDFASATPIHPEVLQVMSPFWKDQFGNASAIHQEGVAARTAIESAREELASLLHVRSSGIVFTGSGTESNNLALLGVVQAKYAAGVQHAQMEIISTKIEHASVLETLTYIERLGVQVKYIDTDADGLINLQALQSALSPQTVLVTTAYVNSEVGIIQPLGKISRIVREAEKKWGTQILVHTDASQAPLWLSCELDRLGVDLMTLDAGKCHGPKGVGVLAFRHGVIIAPHVYGGSQEGGLRPGTENTPLIVGAVRAFALAQEGHKERSKRTETVRDIFIEKLLALEGIVLNGSREYRVANNINISLPGIDSEFAVITLDQKGVGCSTKSACGGAKGDGSSVVRLLTGDEKRARSTIRFTLSDATTIAEITYATGVLHEHIRKMLKYTEDTK